MIFFFSFSYYNNFFFYFLSFDFIKIKKILFSSFLLLFLASFTIYNFIGNKNSFSYNELEKQIKELIKDPSNFANIQPKKLSFFRK